MDLRNLLGLKNKQKEIISPFPSPERDVKPEPSGKSGLLENIGRKVGKNLVGRKQQAGNLLQSLTQPKPINVEFDREPRTFGDTEQIQQQSQPQPQPQQQVKGTTETKQPVERFVNKQPEFQPNSDLDQKIKAAPDDGSREAIVKDLVRGVFKDNKVASNMMRILRWGKYDGSGTAWGEDYGGENLSLDPEQSNVNNNGSLDRGLFQINSDTFHDFMYRKPELMEANNIHTYNDMWDPVLNTRMAKLIFDEQGYRAWWGAPKNLTSPERGMVE